MTYITNSVLTSCRRWKYSKFVQRTVAAIFIQLININLYIVFTITAFLSLPMNPPRKQPTLQPQSFPDNHHVLKFASVLESSSSLYYIHELQLGTDSCKILLLCVSRGRNTSCVYIFLPVFCFFPPDTNSMIAFHLCSLVMLLIGFPQTASWPIIIRGTQKEHARGAHTLIWSTVICCFWTVCSDYRKK